MDVVSLVNFDNPARVQYLDRSFGSFYKFNSGHRHFVFDSSKNMGPQKLIYDRYGIQVLHMPGAYFGQRLKKAMTLVKDDYFLFLPDDFNWIFKFPLENAIQECRRFKIDHLKLTGRGMRWYSVKDASPAPWFEGSKVLTGEVLKKEGDLYVSRRWVWRDFHEQFSLACNILNTEFARWVIDRLPEKVKTPGQAEKNAYLRLLLRRYSVAYYRMWIPAFHFIDLEVEGRTPQNVYKMQTSLIEDNFSRYNRAFNGQNE